MEKLIYLLWRPDELGPEPFTRRLVDDIGPALLDAGARGVQVNVADEETAAGSEPVPAGLRRIATEPPFEAVVALWLDSGIASRREPFEAILVDAGLRPAGYRVAESEPMENRAEIVPAGRRTPGFAQLAFLQRPADLDVDSWLERWHDHHTEVAIETQSTFEYRQNLVVTRFHDHGPPLDAIVEEGFPIEALTSREAFYDAVGDRERFEENIAAMRASTRTFIDHERGLDVLPTGQYVFRRPTDP